MSVTNIKERIRSIIEYINEGAYERQEAISLSLLSALAGESIFLLGLPGVGKSMIARRLKLAFKDAKVFEYLMSRFSTPDEIFGPVSITGLKDHDRYERVTTGYLPEAEVIFLDEIWKAGPAIQNSLLTVLNEKIFLNGNKEIKLPVKAIISASNELPAQGEGLEALWDRFLIRYIVEPIKNQDNFYKLLNQKADYPSFNKIEPIDEIEFEEIKNGITDVFVSEQIMRLLFSIRDKLQHTVVDEDEESKNKMYVSDRRWRKALNIMKTSAFLNGREEVDLSDCVLLTHVIWNEDSLIKETNRVLAECIVTILYEKIATLYQPQKDETNMFGSRPFSEDGKNYTILTEDYPLKISREDYQRIKSAPSKYFAASETKNGVLKFLSNQGQYSIRFIREGVININSFNYNLKSLEDLSVKALTAKDREAETDRIMKNFEKSVRSNMFIEHAEILRDINVGAKLYRERLKSLL